MFYLHDDIRYLYTGTAEEDSEFLAKTGIELTAFINDTFDICSNSDKGCIVGIRPTAGYWTSAKPVLDNLNSIAPRIPPSHPSLFAPSLLSLN